MVSAAWIYSDLSTVPKLLHSLLQLCIGPDNWPSQELSLAGSLAMGYGPDPQLMSDGPNPLMAKELCGSTGLGVSHHILASCKQAGEAVTTNPHQELLRSKAKSKMRREKLPSESSVSQV